MSAETGEVGAVTGSVAAVPVVDRAMTREVAEATASVLRALADPWRPQIVPVVLCA